MQQNESIAQGNTVGHPRRKLIAAAVTASLLMATAVPVLHSLPESHAAVATDTSSTVRSPLDFGDLVEVVQPAVVNISVTTTQPAMGEVPSFPKGSPFEFFFKRHDEGQQMPQPNDPRQPRGEGLGSGFIIDSEGYIVTNHHVVARAEEITVTLNDGTKYRAELKGSDPKTDLALLKIEAQKPLPHVAFGDSHGARVGDWVVAIGNPFGLGGSVTAGIISARGRDIQSGPFDDFLQVDAPINRGNSGGPLFDLDGNVIGINTAIFSPTGGSVGIGFAIPAAMAETVIADLRDDGQVVRGWLGVQIQTVTPEFAESLGLDKEHGALVTSVVPGSPADNAGLQAGDVILKAGSDAIERMRDLPKLVAGLEPDTRVQMTVWRKGTEHTMPVLIGELLAEENEIGAVTGSPQTEGSGQLGLSLRPLTPETRQKYRIAEDVNGAVVVNVAPQSAAQQLRPGDVIVMVGQDNVTRPSDVSDGVKEASELKRKSVLLLVDRQGNERFVAVPLA
jgi:serine protease Do